MHQRSVSPSSCRSDASYSSYGHPPSRSYSSAGLSSKPPRKPGRVHESPEPPPRRRHRSMSYTRSLTRTYTPTGHHDYLAQANSPFGYDRGL